MCLSLPKDGWTPLHAACHEGHAQVAELLLQAGANVEEEMKVRLGVSEKTQLFTPDITRMPPEFLQLLNPLCLLARVSFQLFIATAVCF